MMSMPNITEVEEDGMFGDLTQDPGLYPCSVEDSTHTLKVPVKKNDPPYVQAIKRYNNEMIDECKREMWRNICDKRGKMPAINLSVSWNLFREGKELSEIFIENSEENIPRLTEKQIEWWITFLKQEVDVIAKRGAGFAGTGYDLLVKEIQMREADRKFKTIYTDGNVLTWWKNYRSESKKEHPFPLPGMTMDDLVDFREKVACLLQNGVQPLNPPR